MQDRLQAMTEKMPTPDYSPLALSCCWTFKRRDSETGLFVPIARRKNLFTNYGLIQVAGALVNGAQPLYLVIEDTYGNIQTAIPAGATSVTIDFQVDQSGDTQIVLSPGKSNQEIITFTSACSFVDGNGAGGPISGTTTVTTTSTNKKVTVTLATGPSGVKGRNIYRSKVGTTQLYLLATINDNTTTTYTDSTADTSLTTIAPTDTPHGGLLFRDVKGFLQGYITPTAGRIGFAALNNIQFQVPGGNLIAQVDASGLHINSGSITFSPANGNTYPFEIATGPITYVRTGNTGFGIKDAGTARLLELKNTGDLLISGRYMTAQSSFTTVAGQSFDNFDYAEIYECDQPYPNGTIACPGPNNKMSRCTHDNCPCASVISYRPGFQIGQEDHRAGAHPIALCGRVNVKTAYEIPYRALVVSDGRGEYAN